MKPLQNIHRRDVARGPGWWAPAASAGRKQPQKIKASFRRSRRGVSSRLIRGDPSASGCQAQRPGLRALSATANYETNFRDSTLGTRHRITPLTPRSEATVLTMSADRTKSGPSSRFNFPLREAPRCPPDWSALPTKRKSGFDSAWVEGLLLRPNRRESPFFLRLAGFPERGAGDRAEEPVACYEIDHLVFLKNNHYIFYRSYFLRRS